MLPCPSRGHTHRVGSGHRRNSTLRPSSRRFPDRTDARCSRAVTILVDAGHRTWNPVSNKVTAFAEVADANSGARLTARRTQAARLLFVMYIEQLCDGERSAGTHIELLGVDQANTSQHLAVLRSENILVSRSAGNRVVYSMRDPLIIGVIESYLISWMRLLSCGAIFTHTCRKRSRLLRRSAKPREDNDEDC